MKIECGLRRTTDLDRKRSQAKLRELRHPGIKISKSSGNRNRKPRVNSCGMDHFLSCARFNPCCSHHGFPPQPRTKRFFSE